MGRNQEKHKAAKRGSQHRSRSRRGRSCGDRASVHSQKDWYQKLHGRLLNAVKNRRLMNKKEKEKQKKKKTKSNTNKTRSDDQKKKKKKKKHAKNKKLVKLRNKSSTLRRLLRRVRGITLLRRPVEESVSFLICQVPRSSSSSEKCSGGWSRIGKHLDTGGGGRG